MIDNTETTEIETATNEASPSLSALLALGEAKIKLTGKLEGVFGFESDDLLIIYGAITTPERFARFTESLCHLSTDGNIRRYGRVIGTFENIETVEC